MGEQNQSSLAIIRDIAKKEGFRSLVSGLPTNLIALVPNWMSYFLAYSQFRAHTSDTLLPIIGPSGFDLVSAMVGGTACTICTHPLWLVKARFQVQGLKQRYGDNAPTPIHRTGYFPPTATDPTSHLSKCTSSKTAVNTASSHSDIIYSSTFDALKQIFKSGGLRGLYAGFFPQLLGLLHVGVHFPLYERTKRELYLWNCRMNPNSDDALHGTDYLHHNQQLNSNRSSDPNLHLSQLNLLDPSLKNHLSATQIVIASTISKTIASTIAYPHEIIRSRFQTQDFLDINKANPTLEASQLTTSPTQPQQPQQPQPQPLNNKSPSNSTLHHDHPTQQRIKYTSIPHAIRNIYQTEGIHGFYRGLNVTLLRSVPASIVTFLVYEEMMVLLKKNGTAYPKWLKEQESKLTNQNMEKFKA
jgi:solute carrier family 25 folate transporter 32